MRTLLLLALLGLSQALQPGYEYVYRYRGVSATGMPKVNSQVAGSAFRIEAKVQVITKEDMRVQFSNIWAGDMNERTLCEDKKSDSDAYERMNFGPFTDFLDQLESPFGVKLLGDQMNPFIFTDGDSTWVRNLKRAFVHVLHIPSHAPNFEETPIASSPSFQRIESNPLGECPTWYTITPLGGIAMPKPLSSDVQTDLENTLWKMTKSVDFDNCLDTVSSHSFGVMLDGKNDNRKCGEDFVSTATTGLYYLRGGPRGVRIEKGVQEGSYIVDYEQVHIYTNQSIDLMSVANVGGPLDVSGSQYSFKHEIDDFSWESGNDSGQKQQKSEIVQQIKDEVMKKLPAIADAVNDGQPFNFAEDLDALSKAVAVLSKDDIQELYDGLSGSARDFLMKILTVSGLETPYQFILEKFKTDDIWEHLDSKVHFIMNAPVNLKTTRMVEPIMELVMDTNKDYIGAEHRRIISAINFATLATRMCLNPCGREYLGNTACNMDNCKTKVEDTFLPWLKQRLNDESRLLYERMGYLMVLYNFNSEKILPIIRPYIIGSASTTDVRLRVSAIYALRKDDMPTSTKNEIFQGLMALFDNYQEHYRIREAAFGVMLFWNPEPSWWHYMALNTWRDPNNNIVSLVSNAIYTFKEYRPAAKKVASLTKPVKPKSLANSFLAYNKDGNNNDMMRYWYEFFFSGKDEGVFPRMVSAYIRLGFLNTNFNGFKYTGYFDGQSDKFIWKQWGKLFGFNSFMLSPGPNYENVKAIYEDIIAKLELKNRQPAVPLLAFLHITFFNNIQLFLPTGGSDSLEFAPLTPKAIFRDIGYHNNLNVQAFVNTGRISHAYADEVGVPIMIQYSQPQFFSLVTKSEFQESGNKISLNVDFTFRMDRLTQSTTRALIPWTGTAMVTGVDNRQVIVLPFNLQFTYDADKTQLSVAVNPSDMDTKEHLGFYNTPFSVRAPIVTPLRLSSLPDFKPMRKGPEVFKDDLIFPFTGLNLGAVFVGDVSPMFTRANANNVYASLFTNTDFDAFSPTNKYYKYKLGADYSRSKVNSFELFFRFIKGGDAAKNYVVFPDGVDSTINAVKTGVIFKANGVTEVSHFDTEFTWAKVNTPRYKAIMHLKVHSGPYQDNPASTRCIFVQTDSPNIPLMTSYKEFLEMEHSTQVKAKTFYGVEDCNNPEPLMTLEGKLSLTDDKKQSLGYEEATDCQKNRRDPDNFKILSYDRAQFEIKWKEDQQAKFPFASYLVTYFIPGVLFPQAYTYYGLNGAPARTATLEAFKRLDGWNFKFEKPNMNAEGEQVQLPPFIEDFIVSPKPYGTNMHDRFIHGYNMPICYATKDKIQTFDELSFSYELNNCWTLAVADCVEQEAGILRVRNNEGFEASILWRLGGFEVLITKDQVKVNEEVVIPGTVSSMYEVNKVDGGMLVKLVWGMAVKVTDQGISVQASSIYKGSLCGACSNYDGEHVTATGPKGCSYADYDMYMASWTLPGDGCDDAGLAEKKAKVAEYQATCNKQFVYPTGTVLTSMEESCYEYNYDIRIEGDYVCSSTEPISTCKPGCTSAIPYAQDVLYDCIAGDGVSSKKQTIKDLASYAKPGCHYFKRIWTDQSQGCEA